MMKTSVIRLVGSILYLAVAHGFTVAPQSFMTHPAKSHLSSLIGSSRISKTLYESSLSSSSSSSSSQYEPPEVSEERKKNKKTAPYPKVGDLVRFYDLDGGNTKGQEFVGKITFIQPSKTSDDGTTAWLGEVTELDNLGDGYFDEFPSRKRRKSKLYNLSDLSPLIGSYVRTEAATKIPMDKMGRVIPAFEQYNLEGYNGPKSIVVNEDIVQTDYKKYSQLKGQLLKDAAIAGLVGTLIADLVGGFEVALDYAVGALAGVGYLFFLTIKTDTVGSPNSKYGSSVSNLRFVLPLLVLVGISIQNLTAGDNSPISGSMNIFNTVSKEQFGAAMLGFLTYRLPLFVSQLVPEITNTSGMTLPGSAGLAMQLARESKANAKSKVDPLADTFVTVLLVSGPPGTDRSNLVKKLIEDGVGKFVEPKYIDKMKEPVLFEQLETKASFLQVDRTGRYGLTKDSILKAVPKSEEENGKTQVVVVDADVQLSKKMTEVGGTRLVGVWVGHDSLEKFERTLNQQIDSGMIPIPEDETKESVLRSQVRQIVKDIEYGIVSGIFEFTILNDDFDSSLTQIKNAAEYCFK